MSFSITSLMVNSGAEQRYSRKWVRTISDHAEYLRKHQSTKLVQVTSALNVHNVNNYSGILFDLNIPYEYHLIVTVVNGWHKSERFEPVDTVYIPSDSELSRIRKLLPSS